MRTTRFVFVVMVASTLGCNAQRAFAQLQDICPSVTQLMGSSESDFSDLRGSQWRSPSGRVIPAYDARVTILNGRCAIHEPEPEDRDDVASYSCSWRHSDAQAAVAFAEQLSNAVRACIRRSPVVAQRSTSRQTQHLGHRYSLPAKQRDHISVSVIAVTRTRAGATIHETSLSISAEKEVR
jgi:hypothetical protein